MPPGRRRRWPSTWPGACGGRRRMRRTAAGRGMERRYSWPGLREHCARLGLVEASLHPAGGTRPRPGHTVQYGRRGAGVSTRYGARYCPGPMRMDTLGGMKTPAAKTERARLSADDWAEAALDLIAEQGVAAVAVEPLARRLGVTKGSFYWHFPSRDALLQAALERWEAF